jgi:hypothetical protein
VCPYACFTTSRRQAAHATRQALKRS